MISNSANPLVDIPIVVAGLIGIASLVLLLGRYSSGWSRLENLYRVRSYTITRDIGWQLYLEFKTPGLPGIFNNFRLLIAIATSQTGLVIRALWPVSLFMRPLQVPWSDFSVAESDYAQVLPYEIIFPKVESVQIRISRDAGDQLLAAGATHTSLRVTPDA